MQLLASSSRRDVLLALAASLLPRLAPAQPRRPSRRPMAEAIDDAVRPLIAQHRIPGLAVGVLAQGRRHIVTYGVASRETGQPVTEHTLFEIGSISKTFTALLAADAEQRGHLSLADTPGRWLPDLRGRPLDRATLLHLATYTAGGLPLQFPDDITSVDQAMAYCRGFTPTAPPGVQRRYSNPSIGLLGHAVAQALGRDFTSLCEQDLLPRLGLRDTFLRVPPARQDDHAWGYDTADRPVRVNPGVFDAEAYGVKSTVDDLLRFVERQMRPEALDAPLRRAIEATQVGRFAVGPMVQALGWEQYPWPVDAPQLQAGNASPMALAPQAVVGLQADRSLRRSRLFNKTGSTRGFGGYVAFVPALGLGLVMLANRNIPIAARVGAALSILVEADGTA